MKTDGKFSWWYGAGEEPEVMHRADSREDAIQQGLELESECGFTICEADKVVVSFRCFDFGRVQDDFDDHNEELWGEDGPEWKKTTPEAEADLENDLARAFEAWATRHPVTPEPWTFGKQRNTEYFPATVEAESAHSPTPPQGLEHGSGQ